MKFEIEPWHHNVSDDELLSDIARVAASLKRKDLGPTLYKKHGKYGLSTIARRFGGFRAARECAGLDKPNLNRISTEALIADVKQVASRLGKDSVTTEEQRQFGTYSPDALRERFGSWFSALEKAGLARSRNLGMSNEELFQNLEELWTALGRQPRKEDFRRPLSRYSQAAYAYRFGGWRKALEAFVTYVNQEGGEAAPLLEPQKNTRAEAPLVTHPVKTSTRPQKPNEVRAASWRTRFLVFRRDGFRCVNCGRSPATNPGVILHLDHHHPWSKGGRTTLDNLFTLCMKCNVGKGDLLPPD